MSECGTTLTFAANAERFTVRVAGVCVHDGRVLLHQAIGSDHWVLPGGRVHHGESTADALARELAEEFPIPTTVERLIWVAENVFPERGGRHHEIGFYYLFSLATDAGWLNSMDDLLGRERETDLIFCWFSVSNLEELALYSRFLRQGLSQLPAETVRVVEHDDETTSAHSDHE